MPIELNFDVPFIARLALREKQVQQNYRPIIAVHKWFARRPGTLFRGLILAEFGEEPLETAFYKANSLKGRVVADPFMGGGTPLLEANRVGCDVIGYDINPMAVWVVREEIEHLDLGTYEAIAHELVGHLEAEIGAYYFTRCTECGMDAPVKYFLWVKLQRCERCGRDFDLFPGYLLAEDVRHPKNVLVCGACGTLNERANLERLGSCEQCRSKLVLAGPANRHRAACSHCGHANVYPVGKTEVPRHRLFAIEYYCAGCKPGHKGRFFRKATPEDLARYASAAERWVRLMPEFVPTEEIPAGDETDRLHRWGYGHYRDLFNARQLLGLELSCRAISGLKDSRVQQALATNLSDLLRYQNMLCRYDTMALKSLDIFSIHGFPVSLVQCESNLLGIVSESGGNVGSGGWANIIEKYLKAKRYCHAPFEVYQRGSRKVHVKIIGEWIGDRQDGRKEEARRVVLRCESATRAELPAGSLDAVFTDPPYFGNVQYGELMDFCYVWLRNLVGAEAEGFGRASTRDRDELTGNVTLERGLEHFTEGLGAVFRRMAVALKPGAPLVFTYHHNKLDAYFALGIAVLDARLACSASLPCPAEMGGSIHIHGTDSSIVDTVFVCRSTGMVPRRWLVDGCDELAAIVADDVAQLRAGGRKPSPGDIRCIIYGHLTRMTIWRLRATWKSDWSTPRKLEEFANAVERLARVEQVISRLEDARGRVRRRGDLFEERSSIGREFGGTIPF